MEHEDMLGYFQTLLPEDFLSYQDILDWKFGPPEPHKEPDSRIGIGDLIRVVPYRPTAGFPRHRFPHFALLFVFAGSFTFRGASETLTVTAGQTLFLAPNFYWEVAPCGRNDYGILLAMESRLLSEYMELHDLPSFAAYLHLDGRQQALCPDLPYLLYQNNRWPGTQWYIDELCCEHFEPDRRTYITFPRLLQMIFISLDRCVDSTARKRQPTTPLLIQTILRYMKTNFATVTLQTTADRFGFSPNYLSHLLKKYTGMGFLELKQNECIAQAAQLLTVTNMTAAQVGQAVGIRNTTQFYKLFSERYGMTPAQYRKSLQTVQQP